jgi:NAD(P)-dependent dehydrogenase (short-subunit alcohol dehydrogenase family)
MLAPGRSGLSKVAGVRGSLGRALVDEALKRGAKRVCAASRQPTVVPDARVTPLTLDVTDPAQIQEAVDRVESLDILINNAGVSVPDDLSDRSALEQHLAVNLRREAPARPRRCSRPKQSRCRGTASAMLDCA